MSKVILLMDAPTSCRKCMCYVLGESNNFCAATKFAIINGATIPHHCPLKWLPEKIDIEAERNKPHDIDCDWEFESGYNACIDEILGD